MKTLLKGLAVIVALSSMSFAAPLVWELPGGIGQIGLPFQSTEALYGFDIALKQNIAGASLPVLAIKNLVYGQVGAVGVFGSQSLNAQPYLGLGVDILRFIPVLAQFSSLHLNGFGRYSTDIGKFGAGLSVSYSFAQ